jgi:hypothetical protein
MRVVPLASPITAVMSPPLVTPPGPNDLGVDRYAAADDILSAAGQKHRADGLAAALDVVLPVVRDHG